MAGRRALRYLSADVEDFIRKRYALGGITYQELADQYGVSIKVIWRIIRCHP